MSQTGHNHKKYRDIQHNLICNMLQLKQSLIGHFLNVLTKYNSVLLFYEFAKNFMSYKDTCFLLLVTANRFFFGLFNFETAFARFNTILCIFIFIS